MSDLLGSSGGPGRSYATTRATASGAPALPAGATSSPGVRTPRDIMKDRAAREEARRQAAIAQEAEDIRRRQDEERRSAAERRAAGVADQTRDSGYRSAGVSAGGVTPAEAAYATPGLPSASSGDRPPARYGPRTAPSPYESAEVPSQPAQPLTSSTRARISADQSRTATQQQPTSSSTRQGQTQPQTRPLPSGVPTSQTTRGQSTAQATAGSQPATTAGDKPRDPNVSSFPHAFERWETLSSRWEGLTSYWIRKLENNPAKENMNQEMARQITDLAAAGANLFHAVVELQRLRASSERKFQRWFYETRSQQEQAQEAQATLQRMLDDERRTRAEDVRSDQHYRNQEKLILEYRRELQISKDEARRAWEELGRREQAERDRILALREGHPIDIGGVQVVPHNAPSRGDSLQRSAQQESAYQTQRQQQDNLRPGTGTQAYAYDPRHPSPTDTDPFSSGERAPQPIIQGPAGPAAYAQYQPATTSAQASSSVPPSAPSVPTTQAQARAAHLATTMSTDSPSARFYSQPETLLHGQTARGGTAASRAPIGQALSGSETEEEPDYELDDHGHVRLDAAGQPIRYSGGSGGAARTSRAVPHEPQPELSDDEMDMGEDIGPARAQYAERSGRMPMTAEGGVARVSAAPAAAPITARVEETEPRYSQSVDPVDYEGEAFGEDDEWDERQMQHHHPTRLSDVPEEDDERSRASMSRPSGGSGGMF